MQIDSTLSTYTVFEQYDIMSRFLSYHSLSYELSKSLILSFTESVVFGRNDFTGFDYMFPFFIYYGEQENLGINDNILWNFSLDYNHNNRIKAIVSFLIDDYQYEKEDIYDYEPPMLGYSIKLFIHNQRGYIGIIHHFINAWVYNQTNDWNKYYYNNHNIAYKYAPDIRDIEFIINSAFNKNSGINVKTGYYIKGNNSINTPWAFPIDTMNMYYYEHSYGIEPVEHFVIFNSTIDYLFKIIDFSANILYKYSFENSNTYGINLNASLKI